MTVFVLSTRRRNSKCKWGKLVELCSFSYGGSDISLPMCQDSAVKVFITV